jgi:mannose-6-phosphate isomerase-like protein (cupin superfamily)
LDGTDEVYFILCGRGMVSVGEESRKVGPGDAVWIPAGVPGPAYRAERDERVDAMLAEVRS